jgi:2-methylisocitrate lyase-like PEP mutase family enzyme
MAAYGGPVTTSFQALHRSGCFVLPNAWDPGSAILLQQLGFVAIASTSGGYAFHRGRPDGPGAVSIDDTLAHLADLVAATALPVNADFQNGFADSPKGVAASVTRCVATGVAGLSIEDFTGDPASPLYDETLAVERIQAARAAIDASGAPVVLTARCEALLYGVPGADRIVLDRLAAFAAAGADCLYAPGLSTVEQVRAVVEAVSPLPVNVLAGPDGPTRTVAELADLGVRRVSLGTALTRAAWGGFLRAATTLAEEGTFAGLADAPPYGQLNGIFSTVHSGGDT